MHCDILKHYLFNSIGLLHMHRTHTKLSVITLIYHDNKNTFYYYIQLLYDRIPPR